MTTDSAPAGPPGRGSGTLCRRWKKGEGGEMEEGGGEIERKDEDEER